MCSSIPYVSIPGRECVAAYPSRYRTERRQIGGVSNLEVRVTAIITRRVIVVQDKLLLVLCLPSSLCPWHSLPRWLNLSSVAAPPALLVLQHLVPEHPYSVQNACRAEASAYASIRANAYVRTTASAYVITGASAYASTGDDLRSAYGSTGHSLGRA
eukprot:227036-Rhodomonas_salina.2